MNKYEKLLLNKQAPRFEEKRTSHLRSQPKKGLIDSQVATMLKTRGFYDSKKNLTARRAQGHQLAIAVPARRVGCDSELLEDTENPKTRGPEGRLRGLGRSERAFLLGSAVIVERGVRIKFVGQSRRGFVRGGERAGRDREPAHELA